MYDKMLSALDSGQVPNMPAPALAIARWNLSDKATVRDVVLAVCSTWGLCNCRKRAMS
jgi:ubiquinol oxidase